MGPTEIFNIFEGIFWLIVALFFLVPTIKPSEKHRRFCLVAFISFAAFGLSDFYEVHNGAWWKPSWLILWKGACLTGIAWCLISYIKINGGLQNTVAKIRKPASKDNHCDNLVDK